MEISKRGGHRDNAGRIPIPESEKKQGFKVYFPPKVADDINCYSNESSFSEKVNDLVLLGISARKNKVIKFIDLFAGMGGLRIGFEQAANSKGMSTKCILTSEIKPYAIKALKENFEHDKFVGDIRELNTREIEDFDILLAGFPCQAFSTAGKGHGFLDTRGTLFFEVERILREKTPYAFILENVEGIVLHDRENKNDKMGRTLNIILASLRNLGYHVSYEVLDSKDFGLPQSRKRIFIVGTKRSNVHLNDFIQSHKLFKDVREYNLPIIKSEFTKKLIEHFETEELYGKAIKDKRGGANNIHSWHIELKGNVSEDQKVLLEEMLLKRRSKSWAEQVGIEWMDGMPLTVKQISTFYEHENLKEILDDLVDKGYIKKEHPKKKIDIATLDGSVKTERALDYSKEAGYNIVSGKLSFEFTKFIDDNDITPTIVAMDASKLGVVEKNGVRQLTIREGLRLFGYPDDYNLDFFEKDKSKAFDLLGNTVTIPVVKQVAEKVIDTLC